MTPAEKLAARVKQATGMDWTGAARLADMANARFETFAGVDAKYATALAKLDPYDAIQVRLAAWQSRNFGVPTTTQIVCGIVEELAEWEAADGDDAAAADAVGDTLIYCAQLCTAYRMSLSCIMMLAPSFRCIDNHTTAAGLLCHVALKGEQRIRGLDDRALARVGIAAAIVSICEALDATDGGYGTFLDIYAATAAHVLRRDWRAHPVDAAQVADGEVGS